MTTLIPTPLPNTGAKVPVGPGLDLPAGQYILESRAQVSHGGEGGRQQITIIRCELISLVSGVVVDTVDTQQVGVPGDATNVLIGPLTVPAGGDHVQLRCSTSDFIGGSVASAQLAAVQVNTLTSTR